MARAKKTTDAQKQNDLAPEKATEVTPQEAPVPEVEVKPEGLGQEAPAPEAGLTQEVRCEPPNEVEEKVEEAPPAQTEDAGASGSSSGETGRPEEDLKEAVNEQKTEPEQPLQSHIDEASEATQQEGQNILEPQPNQETQNIPEQDNTNTAGASGDNDDQPHSQPLISLEELAQQFRVPGWQHAALCKLMGWQSGKAVSIAEYETALTALSGRRLGSSGR